MGHSYFGSKTMAGLSQPLNALIPPHSVYIDTHLVGGAIMKYKPGAPRSIGIDPDGRRFGNSCCRQGVRHPFHRSLPESNLSIGAL